MYDDLMTRLGDSLATIGSNVGSLHEELKKLEMPAPVRDDAEQVWSEFFWTWKDVREEEVGLRHKLRSASGQASAAGANADARVAMGWMSTWLQETIDSGHALVSRLDAASQKDPALGGVYTLMRGFQIDIVNAYGATQEALEELGSRLEAEGGARAKAA